MYIFPSANGDIPVCSVTLPWDKISLPLTRLKLVEFVHTFCAMFFWLGGNGILRILLL